MSLKRARVCLFVSLARAARRSYYSLTDVEKELSGFFRREGFYIKAAKLVKQVLVDGIEKRRGRRQSLSARTPRRVSKSLVRTGVGHGLMRIMFSRRINGWHVG